MGKDRRIQFYLTISSKNPNWNSVRIVLFGQVQPWTSIGNQDSVLTKTNWILLIMRVIQDSRISWWPLIIIVHIFHCQNSWCLLLWIIPLSESSTYIMSANQESLLSSPLILYDKIKHCAMQYLNHSKKDSKLASSLSFPMHCKRYYQQWIGHCDGMELKNFQFLLVLRNAWLWSMHINPLIKKVQQEPIMESFLDHNKFNPDLNLWSECNWHSMNPNWKDCWPDLCVSRQNQIIHCNRHHPSYKANQSRIWPCRRIIIEEDSRLHSLVWHSTMNSNSHFWLHSRDPSEAHIIYCN